jgi:hypothetical protein
MIRLLTIALILLALHGVSASKERACPSPQDAVDPKFHPGQVWEYRTRPREKKSRLTILKVESLPKMGTIIHLRVDNIRLRNCTGGPEPDVIEHMPFTRNSVERSVTRLQKEESAVPDFQGGYDEWRKSCGGVYTLTVSEAVQADELTFRTNLGCESPK